LIDIRSLGNVFGFEQEIRQLFPKVNLGVLDGRPALYRLAEQPNKKLSDAWLFCV
jgi:hypothetical protein